MSLSVYKLYSDNVKTLMMFLKALQKHDYEEMFMVADGINFTPNKHIGYVGINDDLPNQNTIYQALISCAKHYDIAVVPAKEDNIYRVRNFADNETENCYVRYINSDTNTTMYYTYIVNSVFLRNFLEEQTALYVTEVPPVKHALVSTNKEDALVFVSTLISSTEKYHQNKDDFLNGKHENIFVIERKFSPKGEVLNNKILLSISIAIQ